MSRPLAAQAASSAGAKQGNYPNSPEASGPKSECKPRATLVQLSSQRERASPAALGRPDLAPQVYCISAPFAAPRAHSSPASSQLAGRAPSIYHCHWRPTRKAPPPSAQLSPARLGSARLGSAMMERPARRAQFVCRPSEPAPGARAWVRLRAGDSTRSAGLQFARRPSLELRATSGLRGLKASRRAAKKQNKFRAAAAAAAAR